MDKTCFLRPRPISHDGVLVFYNYRAVLVPTQGPIGVSGLVKKDSSDGTCFIAEPQLSDIVQASIVGEYFAQFSTTTNSSARPLTELVLGQIFQQL